MPLDLNRAPRIESTERRLPAYKEDVGKRHPTGVIICARVGAFSYIKLKKPIG